MADRAAIGFANPNHAAAVICALFPFCWGWRGVWRWAGRLVGVALCVMLALTQSRTGFVLMAIESIAMSKCKVDSVKCKVGGIFIITRMRDTYLFLYILIQKMILKK